jgi:hypothetical protein
MYRYKNMKQNVSEDQLSKFIYLYFNLYSNHIKVYIYIYIYLLVKFHTSGFILKKYATVTTDMHVSSQYVITDHKGMSDSCIVTICSPDWCLVFRSETWS